MPGPHDHAEDLDLVARIKSGDAEAWRTLLTRHQDQIFATCVQTTGNREWARDLAQEALVRIIRAIDRYDGRAKLSTWMVRIAMNVCFSAMRAEKIRRHASLDASRDDEGPGAKGSLQSREPAIASGVESAEEEAAVRAALADLEPEPRAILILRDVQGLDYDEIGEVLDVPVGTVKSRLFRARAALRSGVEERLGRDADGTRRRRG